MGRHELDEALAVVRGAASVDEIAELIPAVRQALGDIERKRGLFLETAFGCVRRALWSFLRGESTSEDEEEESGGEPLHSREHGGLALASAVALALNVVEPIAQHLPDASGDESRADTIRERGVLAAAGLYLLGVFDGDAIFAARHMSLRSRLVAVVAASEIDLHVLLATMRFREELSACRRALLPPFESDSESDSEHDRAFSDDDGDDDDEGDGSGDMRREDVQWVAQQTSKAWGLSEFVYFLSDSGQGLAFAAWSTRGIGVFAYSVLVERLPVYPMLGLVISPLSALFFAAAYAHAMVVDDDLQVRARGLKLLQVFLAQCPQHQLPCSVDSDDAVATSFHSLETRFRAQNWIDAIVQAMTSAMVSFPEATDRSAALAVLRALIAVVDVNDRFWLLKELALKCPYANVSAILVDFARSDAVLVWRSAGSIGSDSPYMSSAIVELVNSVLAQAAERDLVLHADLIASCLSLYRFLHIRDQENRTGIRHLNESSLAVFSRIQRRLQQKLDDDVSMEQEPSDHHAHGPTDHGMPPHLFLLEAALSSTLSLFEPSRSS